MTFSVLNRRKKKNKLNVIFAFSEKMELNRCLNLADSRNDLFKKAKKADILCLAEKFRNFLKKSTVQEV